MGAILARLAAKYAHENISTEDGLRVTREDSWVHIRASNTEPILRIYGEGKSKVLAEDLVGSFKDFISPWGRAQRG